MDPYILSSRYQPELDQELRSMVSASPLPVYHMMRYHMGWVDIDGQARLTSGGKLLRPSLCLLACEAVGGNWKQALSAAASLELLHNFTLIHDDIEDNDDYRRGIPTVWNIWGVPQGINCGDAMHVLSSLSILKLQTNEIPPEKILHATRLLHETALRLCEGQYLDISFENQQNIITDDYLKMIQGKTAALFACSLKLGAMLGSDNEETISSLYEFGLNLGMAFQIYDDILGIWGEDSKTGKSTASDIIKKKKTLPVVHALNHSSERQAQELKLFYARDRISRNDLPLIFNILENNGAKQYCNEKADYYLDMALHHLRKANIYVQFREDFISLAKFVVAREY